MKADRKAIINQYKNRAQKGGVFAIKNTLRNKWYVDYTYDMNAARNRFAFWGGSAIIQLAPDYASQKGQGFVFEALEDLEKGELQTEEAFGEDLALLKTIWLEKLAGQDFY